MTEKTTLEVYVLVNSLGEYEVGTDEDNCHEMFDQNIGGNGSRRLIKLSVAVTLPTEPEVEVDAPDVDEDVTAKAA